MKLLNARQSTNTSVSSNVITTVEQPFRPACCACSSSLVSASSCVDRNSPTLQNHLTRFHSIPLLLWPMASSLQAYYYNRTLVLLVRQQPSPLAVRSIGHLDSCSNEFVCSVLPSQSTSEQGIESLFLALSYVLKLQVD